MNTSSQLIEGLSFISGSWPWTALVQAADDGEKEPRGPAAHEDARQRLHAADEPPLPGQDDVAIAGGGVRHGAEIEGRL